MAGNNTAATGQRDSSPARTLVRGMRVLEEVARLPGGAGVTEIASRMALDKGTVSRLLATLRELGYVRQRSFDRQYVLGHRCLWLAAEYRASQEELMGVALPFVKSLRDMSGETVHLAIREDLDMVFIAQEEPDRQVRVRSAIGSRLPLHRTAMGRAILAAMAPESRKALVTAILAQAERTGATVDLDEIQRDVEAARVKGWAAVDRHDDVIRIAAPIMGHEPEPIAAITLSGPSYRTMDQVNELGRAVVETAHNVSRALAR